MPAQISKAAIKNYQIGRRIPHCGIELRLHVSADESSSHRLWHKVDIKGIASLDNFHLRYPQSDGEILHILHVLSSEVHV